MNEMVERVARALCVTAGYIPDCEHLNGGKHLDRFIEPARAAIEAMREPTAEMVGAASETDGCKELNSALVLASMRGFSLSDQCVEKSPLNQMYEAMIDKALA